MDGSGHCEEPTDNDVVTEGKSKMWDDESGQCKERTVQSRDTIRNEDAARKEEELNEQRRRRTI